MTPQDEQALITLKGAKQRALYMLNILCKWRRILAGWQLGTRPKEDPESQAVCDQRESILILRAEISALTRALIDKGIFSERDFFKQLEIEARELDLSHENRFPGFRSSAFGMVVYDQELIKQTMKGWKP